MARVEKNAAGKDVRVDTEAFGCRTVERKPVRTEATTPTTKSSSKKADVDTDEGDS